MRILILLILIMPIHVFAKPPECPIYPNKSLCLQSVEETYQNFLDFFKEEEKADKDELIRAAADVKHFETIACHKTCLN